MRLRTLLTAILLAVLPASGALAATITLDLSVHFGSDPSTASSGPISATFEDTGSDEVTLTLDTNGLNLSSEFVSDWHFNFLGVADALTFTYVGGSSTGPAATLISLGDDAYKADGDGWYDILLAFPTAESNRFNLDEMVVYTITGSGVTASGFNDYSVEGGGQGTYLSAAHIQGTQNSGSDWLGAVPEPSTVVLLGLGLTALGFTSRPGRRSPR